MGFSTDLILPGQEGHYSEFTCSICFNLVEGPLLTTCQHIFCTACLQDWFETKPSCPSCTQELDPRHGAGELHLASPLAHVVPAQRRSWLHFAAEPPPPPSSARVPLRSAAANARCSHFCGIPGKTLWPSG